MKTKQLLIMTLGSTLFFIPVLAQARQAQESVVEAARKAQAARKTAPKAKIVIDDDNLDTLTGTVSVVGQEPAPPEAVNTKAAVPTDVKKAPVKDEAYWRGAFADANQKMTDDAHELDILQREYNLKEQQYYSDPNTAMQQGYNRQDLNDTKAKIDEKTSAVGADKQAISDLQDALRQAGGDPGWATPLPQPPAPAGQ